MNKTCFLFSGQGSQYVGMAKELLEMFPELNYIFDTASEILGFSLKEKCFEAEESELAKTEFAQPAIMATSLVAFEAVKKLGVEPSMVAGHSLGEYAAMVASGMISLEDGFRIIKERASAMGKCAENQDGAMAAIIGLSAEEIEKAIEPIDGYVVAVNYNSPAQTVIAGETEAINKAVEIFTEMGKKAVKLAVSAAFHSKMMQPAADEFTKAIEGFNFNEPKIPFYANVYGRELTDFSDMKGYLGTHLVSPVKFVDELNAIKEAGAVRFIECGPNKVLTGLVKKTLSDVKAFNVENAKTYEKLKSALEG